MKRLDLEDVVWGLAFVASILPDRTKERAIDAILRHTISRAECDRNEAIRDCANYLEEIADQAGRAGKKAAAAGLRDAAKGMVRSLDPDGKISRGDEHNPSWVVG